MSDKSTEDEVWSAVRSIFESFEARNDAGIEENLAQECTVWDVFEPQLIQGLEERREFHERDKGQSSKRGPLTWDLKPLRVDVHAHVAIARYYLDFDYQPPNETSGRVRITDVLVRTGDRWLVVHHHEGLAPSGPPNLPIAD